MSKHQHSINQLLHLLSPNHTNEIRLRPDGIFEAPNIGFFKPAYCEKANVMLLYYARHPSHFGVDADTVEEFIDNNHIYPICIKPVANKKGARFHGEEDGLLHHDLSWVSHQILRIADVLPHVLLRECTLYQLSPKTYGSAYIGYCITPENEKLNQILVATNTTRGFSPVEVSPPVELQNEQKGIVHGFRVFGRHMLRRMPSAIFPLGLRYQIDGELTGIQKTFIDAETIPAIYSDFAYRNSAVWHGIDPVKWRENYLTPIVRLHVKLQRRVEEIRNIFHDDKRRMIIKVSLVGVHIALHGVLSFIGTLLLDKLAEANIHETPSHVPDAFKDTVRNNTHLLSIDPFLPRIQLQFVPEPFRKHFPDIRWLSSDKDLTSVQLNSGFRGDAPDDGFATWMRGQFFAPYASAMVCLGDKAKIVSPDDTAAIKVIRLNVPNGLQLYYVVADRTLYGYYHESKLPLEPGNGAMPQQHLPPGSEKRFEADTILKIDLKEGANAAIISLDFTSFAALIHKNLGGKDGERVIDLLSAQVYVPPPQPTQDCQPAPPARKRLWYGWWRRPSQDAA